MNTLITSHPLVFSDFNDGWYRRWARELKQDKDHLDNHALKANKFWQNAVMVQALFERDRLKPGAKGLGFGVGQERLPALFAKHGVHVMATDQDFTTKKAGHWAKHELATGTQSLNRLEICDPQQFAEQVSYMPVDMTKIPRKLHDDYDFLWSNCALGHLGSIPASLEFIEESLRCLKSGGWAVHTTEVNVLSNSHTVTSGNTVIFRLKDLHGLYMRLNKQGYACEPLQFYLGRSNADKRISLRPQFGNDYSKIQVGGHLLTQVILIIHKPERKHLRLSRNLAQYRAYRRGLKEIKTFQSENQTLAEILASGSTPVQDMRIVPARASKRLSMKTKTTKEVFVEFENQSKTNLYAVDYHLHTHQPIVLATDEPRDRRSIFYDKSWPGTHANRAATELWVKNKAGRYEVADYVKPGQPFAFKLLLNAQKVKPGTYTEVFSIVQEQRGWIENSHVTLHISVS